MIVVTGAILFLVLILGGKLRPRQPGTSKSPSRRVQSSHVPPGQRRQHQPKIQKTAEQPENQASWISRIQWPHLYSAGKTYAFLTPLEATRPLASLDASADRSFRSQHPPIPINAAEVTLGSDPSKASLLLTDPSVEGLHARLIHQEDGSFLLLDEGSTAGTWINYKIVPKEGAPLVHGDLIHIGRSGFRFTLRHPDRVRKPVISPTLPGEDQSPAEGSEAVELQGMTPK
jgi:hypothetical protein